MAEYWKSTPTYWCKFCSQYIRDTALEKKNHEASAKHQNGIQRSLRALHKKNDREERDKQRAKDEVARLNGIVGGSGKAGPPKIEGVQDLGRRGGAPPKLNAAQQRKAHAEQLAALGVELPEELKREVTGMGGWETVSERVIDDDTQATERSLAGIIKRESESNEDVNTAVPLNRGVHKRKAEDGKDEEEREAARMRRKAWGSRIKTYPGSDDVEGGGEDLDALLSVVTRKKKREESADVKEEDDEGEVKGEESVAEEEEKALSSAPAVGNPAGESVKREESTEDVVTAPPVVFFKKRKVK